MGAIELRTRYMVAEGLKRVGVCERVGVEEKSEGSIEGKKQ